MIRLDKFAQHWVRVAERLAHRRDWPVNSCFNEWVGVAATGEHWDVGPYRLYRSTDPHTILYVGREPVLGTTAAGRHAAAVTQTLRWEDGTYVPVCGSACFSLTFLPALDEATQARLHQEWWRALLEQGYTGAPDPQFLPLMTRDRAFHATLAPGAGVGNPASGPVTVALSAQGIEDFSRHLRESTDPPGRLRYSYRYLRQLPEVTGTVLMHGRHAHDRLCHALRTTADGKVGTMREIQVLWESMLRTGELEVALVEPLPAGTEEQRGEIVATLVRTATEQLFEALFAPVPGWGTGPDATYALRWRSLADAQDLELSLRVEGWNWALAEGEHPLARVLAPLDVSCLETTYAEVSVPVAVVVESDPLLGGVAVTLAFSDGHTPETPYFGPKGGTASYVVTTAHPDRVSVRYTARIDFKAPHWPTLEQTGSITLSGSGGRIAIHPAEWIRRHLVYLYVRDGSRILPPGLADPADELVLTAKIEAPYLPVPLSQSGRLTTTVPVELSYPRPPGTPPARIHVSALGMIAGQFLRTTALEIPDASEPIALLASPAGVSLFERSGGKPGADAPGAAIRPIPVWPITALGNGPARLERWHDVALPLALVPQPSGVTGWAASLTMVINHRERTAYPVATVAMEAGLDTITGYAWPEIGRALHTWDLVEDGPVCASPAEWAQMLLAWGPIWVVEVGAPYHGVVVGGVSGDGTPRGTVVTLYNPWPPRVGAIERREFLAFSREYGFGAGLGTALVHAR